MKQITFLLFTFLTASISYAQGENEDPSFSSSPTLKITSTSVVLDDRLDQLIWTIEVEENAGTVLPIANGGLDGAPVLGYVFPTTLKPTDVGFDDTDGTVAMAITSHPDFDDTPLWDEDNDRDYNNDGEVWHSHWVVLIEDSRVAGGLSVKQYDPSNPGNTILPTTNPGMPMYMDSPGHPIIWKGNKIRVVIPSYRMNNQSDFNFDAVTAYMQVNGSNPDLPLLGVYSVYSVASGDLSLPFTVTK